MRGSASGCSIQNFEIGDVLAGCDRQVHIAGAEDVYDLERPLLAIDQNAGGLLAGAHGQDDRRRSRHCVASRVDSL